jgi:[acyl-carrier-protein] S-malonyltransferase
MMRPAADGLRAALADCRIETPRLRVISNVNAEYHTAPAGIRDLLYRQLFSPVRWQACIERLLADGCTEFWEIGPNRHLTGMLRKINRKTPSVNIGTLAEL